MTDYTVTSTKNDVIVGNVHFTQGNNSRTVNELSQEVLDALAEGDVTVTVNHKAGGNFSTLFTNALTTATNVGPDDNNSLDEITDDLDAADQGTVATLRDAVNTAAESHNKNYATIERAFNRLAWLVVDLQNQLSALDARERY